MNGARNFGEPSLPSQTAADPSLGRQPNAYALGRNTGAPPPTYFSNIQVTPLTNAAGVQVREATLIVPPTRENRFVTLTAPNTNFAVYVDSKSRVNPLAALALPGGIPYEISLPGNEALYAVTDSPVFLTVQIQIAPAIASDTERRL